MANIKIQVVERDTTAVMQISDIAKRVANMFSDEQGEFLVEFAKEVKSWSVSSNGSVQWAYVARDIHNKYDEETVKNTTAVLRELVSHLECKSE